MNYFTASPFRLSVGTLIQVKVAAQNSEGPGPYSVPNRSGVNVNAVPFKVSLPVL
jgi:fibronectin type 3 domain-containing protein